MVINMLHITINIYSIVNILTNVIYYFINLTLLQYNRLMFVFTKVNIIFTTGIKTISFSFS